MANKARLYAQALVAVSEGKSEKEQEKLVSRLKDLLKKRGDLRYAGAVFREVVKLEEAKGGEAATVVSKAPLSAATKASLEKDLSRKGYATAEETREELKGGLAVFLDSSVLVDATLEAKLEALRTKLLHHG